MPGEVTLAHQVGKDFMPVTGGSQVAYALVESRPTEVMARVRMPLNVALVLDHSGSMKGAKLRNVKEAVKMVIDRLEPTDYVSVVIFDDTSQVVIPSLPANDKPGMKATIDQIRDAGGTTMSLGMIQGLNELRRWNIPNAINRMLQRRSSRSEEHTSELQSRQYLVCRLLLEKKKNDAQQVRSDSAAAAAHH